MKEIKFRAWDKEVKYWKPFSETMDYMMQPDEGHIYWEGEDITEGLEINQYTGLKDKNGKDVYEGDILDFDADEWGKDGFVSCVGWDDDEACFCFGGGLPSDVSKFRKVIGNIYENPELLNRIVGVQESDTTGA